MLYLMPIYFIIALIIIIKLMKKYPAKHRIAQFLLLSFLFYLPVGWDVMLGRVYFYYLCHKDGGIHIYQTVELGPEYWNEDDGVETWTYLYKDNVKSPYKFSTSGGLQKINTPFNIRKSVYSVKNAESGILMGEWIMYQYMGGWVINTWQPFFVRGIHCHTFSDTPNNPKVEGVGSSTYQKFTSYIFLRKEIEKQQGEKQ